MPKVHLGCNRLSATTKSTGALDIIGTQPRQADGDRVNCTPAGMEQQGHCISDRHRLVAMLLLSKRCHCSRALKVFVSSSYLPESQQPITPQDDIGVGRILQVQVKSILQWPQGSSGLSAKCVPVQHCIGFFFLGKLAA